MGAAIERVGEGQEGGGRHEVAGIGSRAGKGDAAPAGGHLQHDDDEERDQAARRHGTGGEIERVERSADAPRHFFHAPPFSAKSEARRLPAGPIGMRLVYMDL